MKKKFEIATKFLSVWFIFLDTRVSFSSIKASNDNFYILYF